MGLLGSHVGFCGPTWCNFQCNFFKANRMFSGTTSLTLDAKGRIAIPARYRAQLNELCGGKLVISYNPFDKCLPIYPHDEWVVCEQKMEAKQDNSVKFRSLQRFLYAHTNEVEMDSNGRVLVPQLSRDEIDLEKDAFLIGHGKKFELWSAETWLQIREKEDKELIESLRSSSERMDIGFSL